MLDFVKNELQNLKDLWIKRIDYSLAVACPCGRGSIHFLPLDDCLVKTSVSCRKEKMGQVEISTRSIKAMFEQDISAAQDLDDTGKMMWTYWFVVAEQSYTLPGINLVFLISSVL